MPSSLTDKIVTNPEDRTTTATTTMARSTPTHTSTMYRDSVNPSMIACVAAFVRALYPEATMFSIDPEEMWQVGYDYSDYYTHFGYRTGTTT